MLILSRRLFERLALLLLCVWAATADAQVCERDTTGNRVCLDQPAERIAALSPGATELVWAAGAGDQVVAVVSYSDYPKAAQTVPRVGSHTRLDLEKLVSLEPDLIIGWVTGNPPEQLRKLEVLGFPVFYIEPRSFEGVSTTIRQLAKLAGTDAVGDMAADYFINGIRALRSRYREASPIEVFYQVWDEPLMTVNDDHLIGEIIRLCGGINIFGELENLVPRISVESLLARNPKAILAGGRGEDDSQWLDDWRDYPELEAVRQGNLYFVPPSLIQRPTPRLLTGSRLLCEKLEQARAKR